MIKEIDGVTYINEKADYMLFVMAEDGTAYLTVGNRHEPLENVAFFRSGPFKEIPDSRIKLPYITEADAPNCLPHGYVDDGTQNRAWVCNNDEWLGAFKLNNDRKKEENNG